MSIDRLKPNNFLDYIAWAADSSFIYGKASETEFGRWAHSDYSTTITGHDFGAGTAIVEAWAIPSTGTVMAVVEITASSLYNLWRSTDNGDNFTQVMTIGDDSGQISDVYILGDGLKEVTLPGGAKRIYLFEYNVNGSRTNGSTNDQVRIMQSDDDGATWSKTITFNNDGSTNQVKHGHVVEQNPETGQIMFASGDSDAQTFILSYDGVSTWPADDSTPTELGQANGFTVLTGKQRYRTVSMLFDSAGNIYTTSDSTTGGAEGGVWKFAPDLSTEYNLDNQINDFDNKTGWYGASINGVHYWTDDISPSSTSDYFYSIYASETPEDAGSYKIIGRVYGEDNLSSGGIQRVFEANGRLVITASNLTGKTYNQTTIIDVNTSEKWIGQIDGVAPVYWVSPTGSNSNSGWSPDDPWLTADYGLVSDRISFGGCIMVAAGAYTVSAQVTPKWDAYSTAGAGTGEPGQPVQIRGEGRDNTSIEWTGGVNSLLLSGTNHKLHAYDVDIFSSSTGSDIIDMNGTNTEFVIYDGYLGHADEDTRPVRFNVAGGPVSIYRSKVANSGLRPISQPGGSGTALFTLEASIVDGGDLGIYTAAVGTVSMKQTTHINYTGRGYNSDGGSAVPVALRNSAFKGTGGSVSNSMRFGGTAPTDASVDYCIVNEAASPSGAQGSHGSVQDPLLSSTGTPLAGSPLENAGQNLDIKYDYNGNRFDPVAPTIGAIEMNPRNDLDDPVGGTSAQGLWQGTWS